MPDEKKLDPNTLKEHLGKHLRTADEFARQERFDEAILEIEKALQLDPKNNTARSFLERVKLMQKRIQEKENEKPVSNEESYEEKTARISQLLAAADEWITKKEYQNALKEIAQVYQIDAKNYYAQAYSTVLKR